MEVIFPITIIFTPRGKGKEFATECHNEKEFSEVLALYSQKPKQYNPIGTFETPNSEHLIRYQVMETISPAEKLLRQYRSKQRTQKGFNFSQ